MTFSCQRLVGLIRSHPDVVYEHCDRLLTGASLACPDHGPQVVPERLTTISPGSCVLEPATHCNLEARRGYE